MLLLMVNGFLNNVPKGVRLSDRASVAVHMGVPFVIKGFYEGVHKVNFTMWETSEMHPRFIPWLKQYDQILVPCHHNVELFSRYHRNVNRVPLGVDGKQAAGSYAATVHTHAIADVTGLQTALDGKAASSHTHTSAAITDFTTAVQAAAPATTDASLLTSGTLADARLSGSVVLTTDSRLSNSRTPTAHASSHQTGGADTIANVVASPAQLTADQNDYAIGTGDIFRVSASAARNITGVVAGTSGQAVLLVNVGTFAITLKHQSTSSAAANRLVVPWAGDYVMSASGGAALLVYDATDSRWRVV